MRANRLKKTFIRLSAQQEARENPKAKEAPKDIPLDDADRISPPAIDRALIWYALVVRPGTHRRVMAAMGRAKIVTYCPVETRWSKRPRSGVREQIQRPLLGSILFVGTDDATSWAAIRFNDDVTGVLSNYGVPLPVPVAELRALADRERFGAFSTGKDVEAASVVEAAPVPATASGIKLGDVAQFGEGIFLGAEVDVVGLQDNEAKVVLKHFRSASIMRVPVSMLKPVAQAEVVA